MHPVVVISFHQGFKLRYQETYGIGDTAMYRPISDRIGLICKYITVSDVQNPVT